jgi:hypothetical protein
MTLSQSELSDYLQSLPKDFCVALGQSEYFVNKDLLISVSGFISDHSVADPTSRRVVLDIPDPQGFFKHIVNYLSGSSIAINATTDHAIYQIATFLRIPPLVALAEQSLSQPLSIDNVFPRLARALSDSTDVAEFLSFVGRNIDTLHKRPELFQCPFDFLHSILETATFPSPAVRWRFIFRTWKAYPDRIFLTDSLSAVPDGSLEELFTSEEFSNLDGQIETANVALHFLDEIERLETLIGTLRAEKTALERQEDSLRAAEAASQSGSGQLMLRLARYKRALVDRHCDLRLMPKDLDNIVVADETVEEVARLLTTLEGLCATLSEMIQSAKSQPALCHKLKPCDRDMAAKVGEIVAQARLVALTIAPNQRDIMDMQTEMACVAHELVRLHKML